MANVDDPFAMSNVLSTIGLVAIILNSFVVVRWGRRRRMLMTGLVGCGVLQLIVAVVYDKDPGTPTTGKVLVALSCLYMMSYNVSTNPLPKYHKTRRHVTLTHVTQGMIATYAWLAGGEIPSQRLRSYTFGLAAAVGFLAAWLTTFTAPYFINPDSLNWGPKYGYIWFPSAIIAAAWVFFFLPELKGRTLEEVDEMVRLDIPRPRPLFLFRRLVLISTVPALCADISSQFLAKLPARKFHSYKCIGSGGPARSVKSVEVEETHESEKADEKV